MCWFRKVLIWCLKVRLVKGVLSRDAKKKTGTKMRYHLWASKGVGEWWSLSYSPACLSVRVLSGNKGFSKLFA